MLLPYKALTGLLGAVTAVQGIVLGEVGQSIPDCGGLTRFEKVVAHLDYNDGLYRSSAPYYVNEDEDLKISEDTIRCLQRYGITHVISVNSRADNPTIRHSLEQHGIVYTALPVADYQAPSLDQVEEAWRAFRAHRASTLVWCGFGHGRTGTLITALQMHAQLERGESLEWTRWLYGVENAVERDVQYDLLDELQLRLRHGYQNQIEPPTASVAVDLEEAERRVMEGDFNGLDCSVALGAALGSSWDFFQFKRSLPDVYEGECRQAQDMLLRQQCGVSDYSRPSANYFGSQGIRIFARSRQGDLIVKGWENSQWWDHWTNRGGYIASEPTAIFIHEGDIRVYARSKDNKLIESGYYDGKWQPWKDLGGEIAGAPSAIYLGDNGIRVYARGKTGRLMELGYFDENWQTWKEIGGYIVDDPSAIWMKDEGIRVYARNRLGQLMEKAYKNQEWQEWKNIGGKISSSPSAVYLGPGDIRVYARNNRYELVEQGTREGSWWVNWSNLGGNIVGSPGAMYMGADNGIRVYVRNAQGNLMETGFWAGSWHDWTDLGRKECQGTKE